MCGVIVVVVALVLGIKVALDMGDIRLVILTIPMTLLGFGFAYAMLFPGSDKCRRVCDQGRCWRICDDGSDMSGYVGYTEYNKRWGPDP